MNNLSTSEKQKIVDLGRLSAEAVQAQYELAAKAVEELGGEVKSRITKLEDALRECNDDLKLLADAAAHIREKGKLVYAQIDEASTLSSEIRERVSEFQTKLGVAGQSQLPADLQERMLAGIAGDNQPAPG